MTKTEILEKIVHTDRLQQAAITEVNKVIKSVSMSDDAIALVAVLHTMNGCLCDTLSILALILCEMLPEEAPEKEPEPKLGAHSDTCMRAPSIGCQCLTCANDHGHTLDELGCCMVHHKPCRANCPDYVKEEQ